MTTGSKTGTGGGLAPILTSESTTDSNIDSTSNEDSTLDFLSWIEQVFADVLN